MVYCRFFQFWLIFPNRNYKSRSIGYNFNWCRQHALHLKKKTLPIFENLVTTSRTTMKVVRCLKIPLTSMCVVVRTPSPGPDFVNSSPPTHPLNWSFNPSKKLSLQPVLKSFITVFIQCNVGLENKLTRAPLLGLAKSIYYGPAHKFLFYLWQSRIDFQLIIKYIAVHVRHFCEGVRIVVLTAHV